MGFKKEVDCLECGGIMKQTSYKLDIYWYYCPKCDISDGSDGSQMNGKI